MFEISTTDGVVSSTSNALAELVAEIIADDNRGTEQDLVAAVSMVLDDTDGDAGHAATAAA